MDLTLFFSVTGIALSVLIPVVGYYYKARKELKNYYSLLWKNSKAISPKDLLNERPYEETYFEREIDGLISKSISSKQNVMIVGPPLSGKTRAFFNFLKSEKKKYHVLAPRSVAMNHFVFPYAWGSGSNRIIFIDDFQNFVEKQDSFPMMFKTAKDKGIPVVVTCHSGKEFSKARNKLIENNMEADVIFGENIFEIGKVSVEDGKKIADSLGKKWDHINFNGTIGSIFMKLSEMQRRFELCTMIEKTILRSMQKLYVCGIYIDNTLFKLDWIKKVALRSELSGKDFEWTGWIKSIEDKEFAQLAKRNYVWAEDAYLEYIIKAETEISNIEQFEDIIEIFGDDSEVLQMAGERAYDRGSTSIDIMKYIKLSINAFERVLRLSNPAENEQSYFKANKYLGMCYWSLSKLEHTKENCVRSVDYYRKSLESSYIQKHPAELAMVKNKIGNTFTMLGGLENKKDNCAMAINFLNDSLKFYSLEEYPAEYARVQNSLGTAYLTASNGELTTENLMNAVLCFEKSLQIRTVADDPKGYAYTKNNLAGAYARISQIEDTEKNLKIALENYEDALKIYNKEQYPFEYGMTLNNIGNVYCMLSSIRDKYENCIKSKAHYERSLEVRTRENAPVLYSNTMFNLSDVYSILFEADSDPEYLHKAIECLNESMDVDVPNFGQIRQGEIFYALGKAYMNLALFEYKHINYNKSIEYFEKAIDKFSKEDPAKLMSKAIEAIQNIRSQLNPEADRS